MARGQYIIITPTGDESSDGYKLAIIAVFKDYESIKKNEPIKAWTIDAFIVVNTPIFHCDFEPNGNGIRMWATDRELETDECFCSTISIAR